MESVSFSSGMTPFFSLGASTQRERIAMLKKAFLYVAGGDLSSFLLHFTEKTEFGKKEILPIIKDAKSTQVLENIKDLMKSSPQKHLPSLRSLVSDSYSLRELLDMGFKMTKNEYTYSKKIKNKK